MKTKIVSLVCAAMVGFAFCNSASAAASHDPATITADALLVRPACLVATVLGGAVFVLSLPVAATSGSIDTAAEALVVKPAWVTFRRPLGDFGYADEEHAAKVPKKSSDHRIVRHHGKSRLKKS